MYQMHQGRGSGLVSRAGQTKLSHAHLGLSHMPILIGNLQEGMGLKDNLLQSAESPSTLRMFMF